MAVTQSLAILTVPVFVVSAWMLLRTVQNLTRTVRGSVVNTIPVADRQIVRFERPGDYDLYIEGRRGSDLAGLDFRLSDSAGHTIKLHGNLLRTTVSGISHVRMKLRTFDLPQAGQYELIVSGIRAPNPEHRIVFSRPVSGSIVGYILDLIALAALTIGSLVGSVLIFVLPRSPR